MSTAAPQELDFWTFVSCARCQLPFASDSGATIPFWLTECGHVICNTHLNTDQSCAQCGTAGIQLVPLQRDMEAPMSEWFRSIPHALDAVAYAAKFQMETMALQIQFYKARQRQQRAQDDRLKRENAELKRINHILAHENAQFREHLGYQDGEGSDPGPSAVPNANGKRPMNDPDQYRPRTSSSRSTVTPLGPNRLTLPPGQHPPSLSTNRAEQEGGAHSHAQGRPPAKTAQRPGSSRFVEQYAYMPPATPQFHPQQLSHNQAAPRRTKQNQNQNQNQNQQPSQSQSQPRGAVPAARFKPAQGAPLSSKAPALQHRDEARQRPMGPPPTPQMRQQLQVPPPQSARRGNAPQLPPSSNRFLPPSQRFAPPVPVDPAQFMPSTSNGGAPQRFVADSGSRGPATSSRAPSRAMANMGGGGQRVPFVPHAPGGFG